MQLPGEFSIFRKKVVFCLVVGGVTPLPPLSGPTTKKKTFFMCVFPKSKAICANTLMVLFLKYIFIYFINKVIFMVYWVSIYIIKKYKIL